MAAERKKYLCYARSTTIDHTAGLIFNRGVGLDRLPPGFKPYTILHPGDTIMLEEEEYEEFKRKHIEDTLIPWSASKEKEVIDRKNAKIRAHEDAKNMWRRRPQEQGA